MPIYEYEREDGSVFEVLQKISEEPLTKCPTTGQKVKRLISESAFHLKGSGWYKTDYTSNGKSAASQSTTSGSANAETKASASSSDSGSSDSGASGSENGASSSGSGSDSKKACGTSCGCH